MLKKHEFSENHKVVETHHDTSKGGSKGPGNLKGHGSQFAGMSGNSEGGYEQAPGFCEGGKMADGGNVFEKAGEWVSRHIPGGGNDYDPNAKSPAEKVGISAGNKEAPYEGSGGKQAEDTLDSNVDKMAR